MRERQTLVEIGLGANMRVRDIVFVAVAAASLLGCAAQGFAEQTSHPTLELPPDLARVLTDYEAGWQARDAKALAALFAEDGFVLSGGRPPVRGRKNIEKRYENSGGPLALRALAYAVEGDLAYIIGGYAAQPGGPDVGKFTLTLRKGEGGRWLIFSDMDNGN